MDTSDTAHPNKSIGRAVIQKAKRFKADHIALVLEYAALSSRPELLESEAERLGEILAIAVDDPDLSVLLNEVDCYISKTLGLLSEIHCEYYQSQLREIEHELGRHICLRNERRSFYHDLLEEYYTLSTRAQLNHADAERLGDILSMAEGDTFLSLLINELDKVLLQNLNLDTQELNQLFENQKARIREFIEPALNLEKVILIDQPDENDVELADMQTIDEYILAVDSWSSYSSRPITVDESWIYQHLQECVSKEHPFMVLDRFYQLFINATGYSDKKVWQALVRTADSLSDNGEFKFVLNRCCYILINSWQTQTRSHNAIFKLISLFDTLPVQRGHAFGTRCIRRVVKEFKQTEQYTSLQRLSQILYSPESIANILERPLGSLIQRYPYLYEHNLLTKDSDVEQKVYVQELKAKAENKFSEELALYNYYRISQTTFRPAKNPTLLTNPNLDQALEYYTGRVSTFGSHKDIANSFLSYSKELSSYREFKDVFYEYLMVPISEASSKYASGSFGRQFRQRIQGIFPDLDDRNLSDPLMSGTCRDILNYLTAESPTNPHYYTFCDLIGNVGYQVTIGLLLRIILFCRNVKPWLEKRFAILFNLYEDSQGDEVRWLVNTLEHTNVALSANFGNLLVTSSFPSI